MSADDQRIPLPSLAGAEVAEAMLMPRDPDPAPPVEIAAPGAPPVRSGPLLPMIIGSALFMQGLDSNIISNALPAMADALGESPVALNSIITAYLVAAAVFLPLCGWVADRFGARTVFRLAIAGFAFSSLLCGLAQTLPMMIGARILQGIAGAMMVPVGRIVLLRSIPRTEIVQAISWLTIPAVLGPVVGPPLGGFLVTALSWHWIFLINVPIGVLGVVLATRYVPDVRETVRDTLDLRGFLLMGLCLATLVFGFDNLGRNAMPPWQIGGLLATSVAAALLYWRHARRTEKPIVDFSLLRIPTFLASTAGGFFSRLIIGGMPFLLALLLQLGFGLSAFEAGLISLTGAVGALAMKFVAQPIIRAFGFRTLLIANAVLLAGMTLVHMLFTPQTPHAALIAALLINGFFASMLFSAINSLAFADISAQRMSAASSLSAMAQQVALSMGVGIAALALHYSLRWRGGALDAAAIRPAFAVLTLLSLVGIYFYMRLAKDAGDEVAGRG